MTLHCSIAAPDLFGLAIARGMAHLIGDLSRLRNNISP